MGRFIKDSFHCPGEGILMNKKNNLLAIFAVGLLAGPMVAQADFEFEIVDHPGAPATQIFGINDRGDAAGIGVISPGNLLPFVYDSKKGTFTDIAPLASFPTAVLGISDSGVLVGNVDSLDLLTTTGIIRDKKGNYTVFSHPGAVDFTTARGVNNKGLVTGFRDHSNLGGTVYGFIHDPKNDTYTDIISPDDHAQSIAQGINSKGEVVGSAFFFNADDPCGNSSPSGFFRNGWHRATDGTVTYFTVNGSDRTAARGINDEGSVVGFFRDPDDGKFKGYKAELDGTQCQSLTIGQNDILDVMDSDGDFVQGINNKGVISGGAGFDDSSPGFIATRD